VKWESTPGDFDHEWHKIPVIAKLAEGRVLIHLSRPNRVRVHVDVGKQRFGWVEDEVGEINHRVEDSFDAEVRS
jgi:hypothetical protein